MERLAILVFLFAVVAVVHGTELPKALQEIVERNRRTGDNSHWCCEDEIPVKMIQRSRQKTVQVVKSATKKTGAKRCHLIMSCTVYETVYWNEPKLVPEYYLVPYREACPDKAVKCCKGFLLIVGNCISLEDIAKSGMTIQELIQKKLAGEA